MGNSIASLEDLVGIEHCKLGFYQDLQQKVEQLRSSNEELDRNRQEIQAVVDGITDLMMVLSEDLEILRVNHVFRTWFPDIEPIGKRYTDIFEKPHSGCEECPAGRALKLGRIVKDHCIYLIDNEYRHFDIIVSPIKAGAGGGRNLLLFKRDVTRDKELQAKFNQAEKMATVGTLAAGVAHEINNPLAAISGFAEGLQRRIRKLENGVVPDTIDDFREYTDTIIQECNRCRDIVKTLLSFSRPLAATLAPIKINRCVDETLFILKHRFRERPGLTLITDLEEQIPRVMADESQLKQVIINLTTNALDAIDGPGEIRISSRSTVSGGVELTFQDSGCGIPAGDLDKLFEPFYTTKKVGQGVGIGLSTCFTIVSSHGGEIKVSSIEGEGAVFTVILPEITL